MHTALALELRDRFTDAPVSEIVDDLLQPWICLPNDLIELRRAHPGILKLFEWPTGVDGLVLPGITNQMTRSLGPSPIEELARLFRADETRFVDRIRFPCPECDIGSERCRCKVFEGIPACSS